MIVDKNILLNLAIKAALKAGESILEVYNLADFEIELKTDNSPLTIADKKAHNVITELLNSTQIPILSEEGKNIEYIQRKTWKLFWLVDPLDGTKEFIKRNGEFTVNIALIENEKPVLGVIYVPVLKRCYVGFVGVGAWLFETDNFNIFSENILENATRLPSQKAIDSVFRVVGSRSHMNDETIKYIEDLKKYHNNIEIVSMGSSLKICMIAEGTANCYPRFGPTMEWDTAAGHAVALAAGKKVTLTDNHSPLTYNKENLLNPWFIVS